MTIHIAKRIWAMRKKKKKYTCPKHGKKKKEKEKKCSSYLKIKDRVMHKEMRVPFGKIPHPCTS